MTIRNENDWILPAALIGAVLLFAVAFAVGFAVGNRDDSDEAEHPLDRDLAAYRECLRDQGIDEPLVELLSDGFSVTYFGEVWDIDPEVLEEALTACEDLQPDVIHGVLDLVDTWFEEHERFRERHDPRFRFGPDHRDFERRFAPRFEEFCELLDEGFIPPDSAIYDELVEVCVEG